MPYLTFLFLFFANLLQTKLFCHLPFMSFPLSIKEKREPALNKHWFTYKGERGKKRSHSQHCDTKVFFSGTRMERECCIPTQTPGTSGQHGSQDPSEDLSLVFLFGLFCYFSCTPMSSSSHISFHHTPMLSGSLLLAYTTSCLLPLFSIQYTYTISSMKPSLNRFLLISSPKKLEQTFH